MPEVVAPAPQRYAFPSGIDGPEPRPPGQMEKGTGRILTAGAACRVMPEVPQNMQEGLNRMELEAREIEPRRESDAVSPTTQYPGRHEREASLSNVLANRAANPAAAPSQPQMPQQSQSGSAPAPFNPFQGTSATSQPDLASREAPSFSPFPKVKGDNIPPSDEEKEEILWNARQHVLHSSNVNMQLSWARDTMNWVEIVMESMIRELNGKPRPATPKVEHELRMDALNIINYLASQEHPEALFIRSKWLEFGKFGYRVDKREAYTGYQRAAALGWGRAEYRMGMLYESSNDFIKAVEHYNKGLKLKDSAASYRLGMMSLLGQHGQKKDFQRGLELIQSAADTADEDAPQGAYVYGMLVSRDLPDINIPEGLLPYNLQIAKMYIEKAAYLGFAKAQLKIGQAFELCQLECPFNPSLSLHYYGLAAKQNQPEAALGVSRWFLFGFDGYFNKNEQLAFKYAQDAASAKLPTGEFAMGYYYEIGIHVEKDLRQAKHWYELAAEHGNKDAVGRLESLNQSKTLTKKDHETATLNRIKSQYGSQKGKRPDRFKQNQVMPTLTESEPPTPVNDGPAPPPKPAKTATPSPKQSPHPSPRTNPTIVHDSIDMPDPAAMATQRARTPAFTVKIDTNDLTPRPKSTAPYPEDDRPPPLNLARPKSTAPYPEDDTPNQAPLSPHFNPQIRPSQGPHADRPGSAFGIRPLNPGGAQGGRQPSPIRQSQSMANLVPPAGGDYRGHGRVASAGWEPQVPASYRQPSPGPGPGPGGRGGYPPRDDYRQEQPRPATTQPYQDMHQGGRGSTNPSHNRLSKPNPHAQKPQPAPPGQFPIGYGEGRGREEYGPPQGGAQPGRDYGPRTSSRPGSMDQGYHPMSDNYDRYSRPGGPPEGQGRPAPRPDNRYDGRNDGRNDSRPDRVDSLSSLPSQQGHNRLPSQQRLPVQLKDRPVQMDSAGPGPGRVGSAPPSSQQRPNQRPSPSPSTASAATAPVQSPTQPHGKQSGQGPATFEEMGIPQGKNESDCVSLNLSFLFLLSLL
jgi:TPR repeat protein